ncbi:MAG TPA: class I SAM-dependent methyltransferase [Ktedonobacterales bacterium]|nr:class I SAM-dependent methyltransferase [Ktedonobacterales bacterium]
MRQPTDTNTASQPDPVSHPRFARYYERASSGDDGETRFMLPLRREVAGLARGLVLEVGAGNGLNFAYYDPARVERVEATEPDATMLGYARERAASAPAPIHLTQATAERLPFADETFDSAVATLVFCSVGDPLRGLREARRVLKPGGALLLVEHVRSRNPILGAIQTVATPLTRRLIGNCHWNRDTAQTVSDAGFTIEQRRDLSWSLMPFVVIHAVK